jgi:hypothetical protein
MITPTDFAVTRRYPNGSASAHMQRVGESMSAVKFVELSGGLEVHAEAQNGGRAAVPVIAGVCHVLVIDG